jgi:hypothetical protein
MFILFPECILFHEPLELVLQCGKSQGLDKAVGQEAEDDYEKNQVYRRLYADEAGKSYHYSGKKTEHHKYHGKNDPEGGIMKLDFRFFQSPGDKKKT